MKLSIPFLAFKPEQLSRVGTYQNDCVEAIIFNRSDLENATWDKVWEGVSIAAIAYNPSNVTFHFPVNDANYLEDLFVQKRLYEAFARASDLGLHGVVIHSNQIRPILEWANIDLSAEREKVVELLEKISSFSNGQSWLALENMPVMDNFAEEIDPLFIYPKDFELLKGCKTKVTWDVCHYSNTEANIERVLSGQFHRKYYQNIQEISSLDFLKIKEQIVHWHFSAFSGIADPSLSDICKEGVIPAKSTLGDLYYRRVFEKIIETAQENHHMVFEIQETDYSNRIETKGMIEWAQSLLSSS